MSPHLQSMVAWKVAIMIVHFFALTVTSVRLHHHWKTKQLWWDDYLVVAPWLFDLVGLILFWVQYQGKTITWESTEYNDFVFSWWTICLLGFSVIWQSRISMAFSIARIFMPGHAYRIIALSFATLLCSCYVTSLVVVSTLCRGSPWYDLEMKTCMGAGKIAPVPAMLFALDVIADVCLIAIPLLMLRKINFPRSERALILTLFSSSALTLLGTILYCGLFEFLWQEGPNSRLLFIALGHFQASLSLVAANLLVVNMLIYKFIRSRSALRKYPVAGPAPAEAEAPQAQPEEINHDPPPEPPPVPDRPPSLTHITLTIMSEGVHFTDPSLISYDRSTVPLPSSKPYWGDRLVVSLP